jgi:hypothetical protein
MVFIGRWIIRHPSSSSREAKLPQRLGGGVGDGCEGAGIEPPDEEKNKR